jgi:biopolymer transport protein ExbD
MRTPLPVVLFATAAVAFAQADPKPQPPPSRSLAAGLVRQQAEIEKASPPRAEHGVDVGAGEGPLALVHRRANGTLVLHELQRGEGDHGPAAEPRRTELPPERPADAPAAAPAPAAARPVAPQPPRLVIARRGDEVTLAVGEQPPVVAGKELDRAAVAKLLREQRERAPKTPHVLLVAAPQTPLQQVLAVHEAALAAGFQHVLFDGAAAREPLAPADRELVVGLPGRLGWKVGRAAGGAQPVCSGEVVVLAEADAPWGAIASLYVQFARTGIWQLGFACRRDDGTFLKLPANLPFDRGM